MLGALGGLMGGPVGAVTGLFGQVAQELGKAIGQAVHQQGGESQPAGGQNHQETFHQILEQEK